MGASGYLRRRMLGLAALATVIAVVGAGSSAQAASGPLFGRCAKIAPVGKVFHGNFENSKCSLVSAEKKGKYEGYLGLAKPGLTISLSTGIVTFETAKKTKLTCKSVSGAGQVAGNHNIGDVTLAFAGCESLGLKCTTPEVKEEGVIATPALTATLGYDNKAKSLLALEVHALPRSEPFFEASCGGISVTVRGSVFVPLKGGSMVKSLVLSFAAKGGKQIPEGFEGAATSHHLEVSTGGGAYEFDGFNAKLLGVLEEQMEPYPYGGPLPELFVGEMFVPAAGTVEYTNAFVHDSSECCGGGRLAGGEQVFETSEDEAILTCGKANAIVTVGSSPVSSLAVKPTLSQCELNFNGVPAFPNSPYAVKNAEPEYVYQGNETLELTSRLVFEAETSPGKICTLEVLPATWKDKYLNNGLFGFMGAELANWFEEMHYEWGGVCFALNKAFPNTEGLIWLPDEFFELTGKVKFQ